MVRSVARSFVLAGSLVVCGTPAWAVTLIAGSEATYNGHDYALLTTDSWTASEAYATTLGAHLVTINDLAENAFVFSTYANYGSVDRALWIGLYYQGPGTNTTTDWAWADGDSEPYRNWWPGDPNGFSGEPYVAIVPPSQSGTSAQWFDVSDGGKGYPVFGVIEFTSVPEPASAAMTLGSLVLVFAAGRGRRV
jgi:hypothetical protein